MPIICARLARPVIHTTQEAARVRVAIVHSEVVINLLMEIELSCTWNRPELRPPKWM